MDKITMEMTENGDLSAGSLYELNQQAYNKVKPLNTIQKKEHLSNLYEWVKEQRCDYVMLLCHERRDYTILHFKTREDKKYREAGKKAFEGMCLECINGYTLSKDFKCSLSSNAQT